MAVNVGRVKLKIRALTRLRALEEKLGGVELSVLADIAQRLVTGKMVYGDLEEKFGKGYDWLEEAREEELDRVVYLTAWKLDNNPEFQ